MTQQTAKIETQTQRIDTMSAVTTQQISQIAQTSTDIIISQMEGYVETNDFEEYKRAQAIELDVMSDELMIKVNSQEERITKVEGDVLANYEQFTKYFHFTNEGLIIGEEGGNQIAIRLDNDLLTFLRNGFQALTMNENGLEAASLKTNQITIGHYSIIGEDDGRISLRKTN